MVLEIIKTLEAYDKTDISPTVRRRLVKRKLYDRTAYQLPLGRVIVDYTVEMVYFMYTDPDFAIVISFNDGPTLEMLVNEFIHPYRPLFPPTRPAATRPILA